MTAVVGEVVVPTVASASVYSTAVLADSPTAYWRLDEGPGATSAADSSASGTHGAGSTAGWQFGIDGAVPGGTAARFTEDAAQISGDQDFATTSRTVEAWVRQAPGTTGTDPIFWVRQNTSVGGSPLEMVNGHLHATIRGSSGTFAVTGSRNLADGMWHHVAMTAGGGALILYVDGAFEASTGMSGSVYPGGNLEATIGFRPTSLFANISFTGDLDEIAVYPSVLSAGRIAGHYVASGRRLPLIGGSLTADERRAGGSPSQLCPVTCDGDPVTSPDGEFWQSFEGFSVPGRGRGLSWSLSYSSTANTVEGPLGFGWTHDLAVRADLDPAGTAATIVEERGSRVRFVLSGGTWTPASPRTLAQLIRRADGGWTFTRRHGMVFEFDAAGRMTSHRDRNGETVTLTYTNGELSTVSDEAGRALQVAWSDGRIANVTDPLGRGVSFAYVNGELRSYTDVAGGTWLFTYDPAHRVTTTTTPRQSADPTPAVVENHYDAMGRIDWQRDELGRTTTFDYTTIPGGVVVTDPAGDAVARRYADGVPIEIIEGYGTPDAVTTALEYDTRVARVTRTRSTASYDPGGRTVEFAYDARGNRILTRDGLGNEWTATFNSLDDPLTSTDANGVTTTHTYTAARNPATVSTPLTGPGTTVHRVVQYVHGDPAHPGDVTAMIDPRGKTWEFEYDPVGYLSVATDPEGHRTTTEHNLVGWMTRAISARGNEPGADPDDFATDFEMHNPWGDWTRMSDPAGEITTREFDPNGLLKAETNAVPDTTTYEYDDADQLVTVQRADGTSTSNRWRLDGLLEAQIDAADAETEYDYDSLDRTVSVTDPLGGVLRHRYDAAGNVIATQQPDGNCAASPEVGCILRTYDGAERLTGINYSDPGTPDVTAITYDGNGQRTGMTDGTGASTWSWDSLGRLTTSATQSGGSVGYGYDLAGNVTSIDYPGGAGTVTRTFDDVGRLEAVTDWLGKTSTFDYDANSNPVGDAFGNGTSVSREFDERDSVTGIGHARGATALASFDYTRDKLARNAGVVSTGVPADTHSYDYNPLQFLTEVDNNPETSYGYDTADNLTRLTNGVTQSFDAANQLTHADRAVTLVGTAHQKNNSATTVVVALPGGVAKNDQILLAVTLPSAQAVSTPPAGYSQVTNISSGSGGTRLVVYRRTAAGGETNATVEFNGTGLYGKIVIAAVYRGVDPGSPLEPISTMTAASASSLTVPSLTASLPGARLVLAQAATGNLLGDTAWTPPAGMTERQDASAGSAPGAGAALADQALVDTGATGARKATYSTTAPLAGVLMALKPARTTYGYDDSRGNRTSIAPPAQPATSLGYDQANRLTSYGTAATYSYRGDGLRAAKTVAGAGTGFVWDVASGLPLLLSDVPLNAGIPDLAGATHYVYGPGGRVLEQIAPQPNIALVGTATASTPGTASTLAAAVPAGRTAKDQILVATVVPAARTASTPSGYTAVAGSPFTNPNGTRLYLWGRTANGTESQVSVTYQSGVYAKALLVAVYRGVDPAEPFDGISVGTSTTNTVTAPGVTTTVAGDRLLMIQAATGNLLTANWTQPPAMTERDEKIDASVALALGDQALPNAGATDTRTATFSGAQPLVGVLVALRRTPTPILYHHHDQLGSTRALTNNDGTVVATYTYDAYGNPAGATGTATNPFRYAGQYTDPETGYQYLRARYYDPATGQFLTRDPMLPVTREPYGYAANNPTNFSDPTGEFPCWGPFKLLPSSCRDRNEPKTAEEKIEESCEPVIFPGNSGFLAYQTNPDSGRVQWGFGMFSGGSGAWTVDVFVDGRLVDAKHLYLKGTPHGSLPPSKAQAGSVVTVEASFLGSCYMFFTCTGHSVPNRYVVPAIPGVNDD